jgi:flavin reductase (DIM6/NTAB) family NADH-FMN oxidoreductase RutF
MNLGDEFSDLVSDLCVSMVIVTTANGADRAGCLVGFHSQCSIDPPRYVVWLSKANRTYRIAATSDHFAVHVTERSALDVVQLFGEETGDDIDKFARCTWSPGPHAVPLLDACPNRFVGRRIALVDVEADHVGVVLEPVEVHRPRPAGPVALDEVVGLDAGHESDEV